jgi:hypothetical protein
VAVTAREPKIKGLAFIEGLRWYSETHGHDRLLDAAESLPPHLGGFVTDRSSPTLGLLCGSWYPSELVRWMIAHFCRGLARDEIRRLASDFADASIGTTLTGTYAALMRTLGSPELVAAYYQKIWRLYQSTGDCRVIVHSPTKHELQISDWSGHDGFFCLMSMYASRRVLETVGCRSVRASLLQCVDGDATHCSYVQTWVD